MDLTVDEYGTMYAGEKIVGDLVPVAEGADTYLIVVRDRQTLLDTLDAVPRAEFNRLRDATDRIHREALRGWSEAVDRAEHAKRERDRLRVALRRYGSHRHHSRRDACALTTGSGGSCDCGLSAALSADVDADAEDPTACDRCGGHHEPRCDADVVDADTAAGATHFCGAWNDELGLCERPPGHPEAHERVTGLGTTVTWTDAETSRTHSRSGQPIKRANVADGGVMGDIVGCHECGGTGELHDPHELPEDAEPQDTEPSRAEGDTSTDVGIGSESPTGTGESLGDGRIRAIKAATQWTDGLCWDDAERAIDAALAEGGVVTVEEVLHERWWGNAHFDDWKRERERARELEEALRPFAEFLDALDVQGGYDPVDGWLAQIGSDPPVALTIEALHHARTVLRKASR